MSDDDQVVGARKVIGRRAKGGGEETKALPTSALPLFLGKRNWTRHGRRAYVPD